jgi:U6 snRNA-associated Sm-like protein LSm6
MSEIKSPADFLQKVIGKRVRVKLNSGIEYRGLLSCLDGYMNIALQETQEFFEGVAKAEYGEAFIRGNNVLFIGIDH